jgi:hypothetical protein
VKSGKCGGGENINSSARAAAAAAARALPQKQQQQRQQVVSVGGPMEDEGVDSEGVGEAVSVQHTHQHPEERVPSAHLVEPAHNAKISLHSRRVDRGTW